MQVKLHHKLGCCGFESRLRQMIVAVAQLVERRAGNRTLFHQPLSPYIFDECR